MKSVLSSTALSMPVNTMLWGPAETTALPDIVQNAESLKRIVSGQGAQVEAIDAVLEVEHGVGLRGRVEDEHVVFSAAEQPVDTGPAGQRVAAFAAVERVVAGAPDRLSSPSLPLMVLLPLSPMTVSLPEPVVTFSMPTRVCCVRAEEWYAGGRRMKATSTVQSSAVSL